ncbi:hypothetical protein PARPLA_02588 [Rhodobacteraceae bacterium THAF1]|uniref:molybdopterin-binding protein n=1 Tax=Palleronia sp. THAF1 TaxID=2587842 RepID=UPI000F3C756F|nr:molybdopterin-binding protein [Palleronia sp. THAF1]QFU08067.1 hypothetical protein FIU81_05215 [Palleronia sp. THAF1]VDC27924.1 hypothetical protein PARPLA_02588 [Rhodobacteraceae bacterium THAF1]
MDFGEVPLDRAEGAILAHSLRLEGGRIRKGRVLSAEDIVVLRSAGVGSVVAASLAAGDLTEDAAAARIAAALVPDPKAAGLRVTEASTGRVNFYATGPGILGLDTDALHALNLLDPTVTVATLAPFARVEAGTMVATVKIISYAVDGAVIDQAAALCANALTRIPVKLRDATLIITDLGQGPGKGEAAIATRLDRLGMALAGVEVVPHDAPSIATALAGVDSDLALLLTASATSDIRDVGPEGLVRAGGRMTRFGMPVDPGNLLFYGDLGGRPVIGLPGCARSPALNGADWVLERLCCGLVPTGAEIAAMGVGGLLKESPARPHPRAG